MQRDRVVHRCADALVEQGVGEGVAGEGFPDADGVLVIHVPGTGRDRWDGDAGHASEGGIEVGRVTCRVAMPWLRSSRRVRASAGFAVVIMPPSIPRRFLVG